MPITKSAYRRYLIYDQCLRNRIKKYFKADIKKALEQELGEDMISDRQFENDLEDMENLFKVNIDRVREGRRVYLRYEDPEFSILNTPLGQDDLDSIEKAVHIISSLQGLPQFEWVDELIPLLEDKLNLKGHGKKVLHMDSNAYYQGLSHIQKLFQHIINKETISLQYRGFKSSRSHRFVFHPQILKEYNNRWYIIGVRADNPNDIHNLALDRIESIMPSADAYIELDIDWEEYFDDFLGVTRMNGGPEEVVLKVSPISAPYVETKPFHPTQKQTKLKDGSMEIRLQLIPNYELEQQILFYGENIQVLQPESLRMRLAERIARSHEQYLEE